MAQVMTSPEMEHVAYELARTATAAGVQELSEDEAKRRIAALSQEIARTMSLTFATAIRERIAPAAGRGIVREMNDPEMHKAVTDLVDAATRQVMTSTAQSVNDARAKNKEQGKLGLVDRIGRDMTLIAGLLALIALTVILWALEMRRRAKQYRRAILEALSTDGAAEPETRMRRLAELLR
jgi:hypothetical protein